MQTADPAAADQHPAAQPFPSTAPVAIIGGGPVGLLASIMLTRLGVQHVLFERHPTTSIHPKAVGLNQRTAEVFRELGIDTAVRAAAAPPDTVGRTSWYTSLGGDTELHGTRLAIRDAWGGGGYAEEYAAVSPATYTTIPQIRLEPILLDAARASEHATICFGTEVTGVDARDDGTSVTVQTAGGGSRTVEVAYAIIADGGRTVAAQLGIAMQGPRDLLDMVSAHFSADLHDVIGDRGSLITWLINPDFGGSIGSGYLYHIGPWDEDGRSKEWVFACAFAPSDPDRFDEAAMIDRISRSLGLPALEADVHSISHWYIQAVTAERYRAKTAFLVGDAAHRIPPWGALGLNTGIGDVRNLTWKIAAALRLPDLAGLLDTYEAERLPIGKAVAARSLSNFQAHGGIVDRALGLSPALPAADGWARIAALQEAGADGDARRLALQDAMRVLDEEFHAHGTECGYSYASGAIAPDGTPHRDEFGGLTYTPTSAPGHHLPHAWLFTDGKRISSIDLALPDRWVLIVGSISEHWREALAQLPAEVRTLIDVVEVSDSARIRPADARWDAVRGVAESGAVLVRPDAFVAWRAADTGAVAAFGDALEVAFGRRSAAPASR